jgi:hypothetical protein
MLTSVTHFKPRLPVEAAPEAAEISSVRDRPAGLLVLNAVPPPPDVTGKIPRAEQRSLFAVTPGDTTIIAEPAAGTKSGGISSDATGNGVVSDVKSGDALANIVSGGSANSAKSGAGTGAGGHYGTGFGTGLNATVSAAGTGRGSAMGSGLGSGSSTGAGTGAGRGSAMGAGTFPGITIQGGRYGNSRDLSAKPETRHHSYAMTIESTGSSGGGLPDYGVFRDDKVYTVYLDMRSSDTDSSPSWTLQYALLQPEMQASDGASHARPKPTPPYATLKEIPQLAPELMRQCAHRLIVASAILDTSGKLDDVSVKQTPQAEIIGPLTDALKNWIFEPAKIEGRPVALKVLLGIRLAAAR